MELGIGTVQFGLNYGISNTTGRCSPDDVGRILEKARRVRINLLDTAASYGESERVLGESLPPDHGFRIVTKLGPFESGLSPSETQSNIENGFAESLARLGQSKVYGVLLHRFRDVLEESGKIRLATLENLKANGRIEKFGVSVYSADQIDHVLEHHRIDLIQLPLNILDQRLIGSGHLRSLRERGIEIHARSVFLQGLLLMDPASVPEFFRPIRPQLDAFHEAAATARVSPLQAALSYVRSTGAVDSVLVGVNSVQELSGISEAWLDTPELHLPAEDFNISDQTFLNPANWPAF